MASILDGLLNRVRYAGRDFWTFYDDLKARTAAKYGDEFNDWISSGIGVMLMDLTSWAAETLSWYLDRMATECYLATARTRTAVERLCRQIGYKMYGAISGSVDLTVTLDQAWGFDVTIPEGFQFAGPNDTIWEATQDVLYPASDVGPKTVSVREGESQTATFTSNGAKNQIFTISGIPEDKYLAQNPTVLVGAAEWDEVEFLDYEQTDQFEIAYGARPPKLRFGDGIAGNIPGNTEDITIEYVVNSGEAGVASSDTINDVVTPLIVATNQIDMTITNPEKSSGAATAESIEHAKSQAPKLFKARDNAITREDFESLSNGYVDSQFGVVEVSQAISPRSAAQDGVLNTNLNIIRELADEPVEPTATATAGITSDLADIANSVTDIDDAVTAIDGSVTDGQAKVVTSNAAINDVKNNQDQISVDADDINARTTNLSTNINAITTGATDGLTAATKALLLQDVNLITAEANNIKGDASSSKTSCDSAIGENNDVSDLFDDITTETAKITVETANITSESDSIAAHVVTIQTVVVDSSVDIRAATDEIYDHVNALLSAECKANVVEVPILTKDADGFYAAPSLALIDSLQTYLEGRKEPTVTVKVGSGAISLVEAEIEVDLGVTQETVKPKAKSNAEAIMDDLLRGRAYGVSLYESDISTPMKTIDGVSWVNVRIQEPSNLVDTDGNLIISSNQIVTKGTITVASLDV